jgi:hypothetical protein
VLDHESKSSAESLVKIRYLMGVANDVLVQRNNPEEHTANQLAGPSDDD